MTFPTGADHGAAQPSVCVLGELCVLRHAVPSSDAAGYGLLPG